MGFVSYGRAYQEHTLKYVFPFKALDMGGVATGMCLLRMPRIKEILGKKSRRLRAKQDEAYHGAPQEQEAGTGTTGGAEEEDGRGGCERTLRTRSITPKAQRGPQESEGRQEGCAGTHTNA